MLEKLLEFGTVFDWISPLIAEIQDRANGPSHTFLIPEACGWSGCGIEDLLRSHGIKTWGLMIVDHMILITVRLAQARWAQYLLERERIPIAYGALDRSAKVGRPARKSKRASPFETLDGWLDELAAFLDL